MNDLAIDIGAPVAIDHAGEKKAGDQEEVRHPERLCELHDRVHEALAAGRGFDAERRMHHHYHDDADALGIVDPVQPAGG